MFVCKPSLPFLPWLDLADKQAKRVKHEKSWLPWESDFFRWRKTVSSWKEGWPSWQRGSWQRISVEGDDSEYSKLSQTSYVVPGVPPPQNSGNRWTCLSHLTTTSLDINSSWGTFSAFTWELWELWQTNPSLCRPWLLYSFHFSMKMAAWP